MFACIGTLDDMVQLSACFCVLWQSVQNQSNELCRLGEVVVTLEESVSSRPMLFANAPGPRLYSSVTHMLIC